MKHTTNLNRTYMVRKANGIGDLADTIFASILSLDIKMDKRLLKGLAEYVSGLLFCMCVCTSGISVNMPRDNVEDESKLKALFRFIKNPNVTAEKMMAAMAHTLIVAHNDLNGHVVFMMDQSKIKDGRECLMISIRFGKRAIPYLWTVVDTKGSIGFKKQKKLLDAFCRMLPEGTNVLFTADRFYGHGKMIKYCAQRNWQYRLRLKGNMYVHHEGKKLKTEDIRKTHPHGLYNCRLMDGVETSIAVVWDAGQQEPWIIAMDGKPTQAKARQYGQRWGIEAMFSDFKSRGFNITETKVEKTDRIERLILIAAVAMYFAASTGMELERNPPKRTEKKAKRSMTSLFTTGNRRITDCVVNRKCIPSLWAFIHLVEFIELLPLQIAGSAEAGAAIPVQ